MVYVKLNFFNNYLCNKNNGAKKKIISFGFFLFVLGK